MLLLEVIKSHHQQLLSFVIRSSISIHKFKYILYSILNTVLSTILSTILSTVLSTVLNIVLSTVLYTVLKKMC